MLMFRSLLNTLTRWLTAIDCPLMDWLSPVDATDCPGGARCTCHTPDRKGLPMIPTVSSADVTAAMLDALETDAARADDADERLPIIEPEIAAMFPATGVRGLN